jgi:hypothetical protein
MWVSLRVRLFAPAVEIKLTPPRGPDRLEPGSEDQGDRIVIGFALRVLAIRPPPSLKSDTKARRAPTYDCGDFNIEVSEFAVFLGEAGRRGAPSAR